jgi:hypothetical protein
MNVSPLRFEVQRYNLLRQRLLEAFPETDDETIRDTLEGITTLNELIAEIIRSALIDESLLSGLRSRLDDMKERQSRLERRGIKKRQLALEAMSEVGVTKLEQPDFTVSLRAGPPSLVVIAESDIPKDYWVPQPARLDRQAVLRELKGGAEIPGTQLSNTKFILTVRTK